MKPNDLNDRAFVIQALRRASYGWPPRSTAFKKARVRRGVYRCAICGEEFGRKEVQADHIDPVVDIETGFTNWDDYINRLYCEDNGWQILCKASCHKTKTFLENQLRLSYREDSEKRRK
jgi:hypothetical protein